MWVWLYEGVIWGKPKYRKLNYEFQQCLGLHSLLWFGGGGDGGEGWASDQIFKKVEELNRILILRGFAWKEETDFFQKGSKYLRTKKVYKEKCFSMS